MLLTDEAEGQKFKLTDGVDVADDGMIYFTDASYKYYLREYILDIFEGKPNGRLLGFDPVTKETKVLVSDLYFANGVVLSPDQTHLVYCETSMYVVFQPTFLSLRLIHYSCEMKSLPENTTEPKYVFLCLHFLLLQEKVQKILHQRQERWTCGEVH